jgi:hypothetical protein
LFTRFYNLDRTARFTQDESSDLLRIHQYFVEKKITLVGPISNDNTKVFGSLTFYMLMPFVVAANFDPIGPAYGAAFWGVLTAILLVLITIKVNPKHVWAAGLLVLIWYPLVETSRWAWNPHYVTFWIALGIYVYLLKKKWSRLFAGIFLGLAFHNHYLAGVATGVFVGLVSLRDLKRKRWMEAVQLIAGYILPFIPFVIFDLRHPPGLFFAKYLFGGDTPNMVKLTASAFFDRLTENVVAVFQYITIPFFSWLTAGIFTVLVAIEWKKLDRYIWLLPIAAQMVVGSILTNFQTRYFLPALAYLFIWMVLPRKGVAKLLAQGFISLMIISSLITIVPQLTTTLVPPDIYSLRAATNYIAKQVTEKKLKNANVAALSSPDSDPLAARYRDALSVKNIGLKAATQYDTSEHLFVMSTSDIETLVHDESTAMKIFTKGKLDETYIIPESEWKVYWFHY